MRISRRTMLAGGGLAMTSCTSPKPQAPSQSAPAKLELKDFQPRSMLHVPETKVPRARFPVIDIHTHLCWAAKSENGVALTEKMTYLDPPDALLKTMDACNLQTMVNVTGGVGAGLKESVDLYDRKAPGRFVTFTEPWWSRSNQPNYAQFQADELARAKKDGARGLKVLKTLGLYLRENITSGPLVKVDDKRFDPMWEQCAALGFPVAIHVADPEAFFLPTDRYNERYEELNNHPDWSFHGKDFPSFKEIMEARDRLFARHPKTQFIALHVGHDAENLAAVSEAMNRFPNMHVELGARIGELGRQPRTSRKFFDKYQDRILFGTDAVPHGDEYPQQVFNQLLYSIYYRFLETEDEYFDYAPAAVPPQGRWRIYGVGLPEGILRKVYNENAKKLLALSA